mgnify:CR=1 FL=1
MGLESFSLHGKTALITGGGTGIGLGIARAYIEAGGKVILVGRTGSTLQQACGMLGENAAYYVYDIHHQADIKDLVDRIISKHGPLHILVNNAAVTSYKPFLELTEKDLDYCIDTNLRGTFLGMKYAIPEMIKAGGGSVINISSIAADHAQMGSAVYAATKSALFSMTIADSWSSFHCRCLLRCRRWFSLATGD